MRVLVAGGAGYIGAHVVRALDARGHEPIIMDDFRHSNRERVGDYPLVEIPIENTQAVLEAFSEHQPEAIVHLGGYISVGESVRLPEKYWSNNLGAGMSLLTACSKFPIKAFLFSSTAAVYGDVEKTPIAETAPLQPTSPYGDSKLAFEKVLHQHGKALGFRSLALRYFNASGACVAWGVGENHEPEEHLIPRVIRALKAGDPVYVYGNDYPTPDGTCVRDYIHVLDLAQAHVLGIESDSLQSGMSFNVGTGSGFSVLQVIEEAGKQLEKKPNIHFQERRPGDPPSLVADPSALLKHLDWKGEHSTLSEVVGSAIAWETQREALYS